MKINTIIIGIFLVSILFLSSCAQQQTKYVCPDGSTVSDASYCPKKTCELSLPNPESPAFGYHVCEDETGEHSTSDEKISMTRGIQKWFECSDNICVEKENPKVECPTLSPSSKYIVGGKDGKSCYGSMTYEVEDGWGSCVPEWEGSMISEECVR